MLIQNSGTELNNAGSVKVKYSYQTGALNWALNYNDISVSREFDYSLSYLLHEIFLYNNYIDFK